MVNLNQIPGMVMILVMAGLIFGAGLLALTEFDASLTAGSEADQAVDNMTRSIGNFAKQMPTVGTILGVAVIIMVVVGAFMFGGRAFGGR